MGMCMCVLIVCYLEASKRGDSGLKLDCSAAGNKIHKSCNEPFRTLDRQRVNVLAFDMTDVMNDQIMDGMVVV